MPITPLPTPPSSADLDNFDERADAFLGALPQFAIQANKLEGDLNNKHDQQNNQIADLNNKHNQQNNQIADLNNKHNQQNNQIADLNNKHNSQTQRLDALDLLIPLGAIFPIALISGINVPPPGEVRDGFMICDGSKIPNWCKLAGYTPNLIDGRFLRGMPDGEYGGSDRFEIATNHLPPHSHKIDHSHGTTASGSHTHNAAHDHAASASASGTHNHTVVMQKDNWFKGGGEQTAIDNDSTGSSGTASYPTNYAGSHSHNVYVHPRDFNVSHAGNHTHNVTPFNGQSGSTGSGHYITHIPKYYDVLYIIRVV